MTVDDPLAEMKAWLLSGTQVPEFERRMQIYGIIQALQARAEAAEARVAELEAEVFETNQKWNHTSLMLSSALSSRNKALEDAAKVADPKQPRASSGLWVQRRRQIAAAIRALKSDPERG